MLARQASKWKVHPCSKNWQLSSFLGSLFPSLCTGGHCVHERVVLPMRHKSEVRAACGCPVMLCFLEGLEVVVLVSCPWSCDYCTLVKLAHILTFPKIPFIQYDYCRQSFNIVWSCILWPKGLLGSKALSVGNITHALGSFGASPDEDERKVDCWVVSFLQYLLSFWQNIQYTLKWMVWPTM